MTATELRADKTNSVTPEAEARDAAYIRTLNERVTKILSPVGISDAAKSNRVHGIIVQQYRGLNDIQFVRDVRIENIKAKAGVDKNSANAAIQAAHDEAKPNLERLHGEFLAKLSSELSSAQVDQVKNGMTYGVLPLTYGVYLKMYSNLTDEQKQKIKDWLTEARELAMDAGSSQEKHAVFGKYKGKINNYLSAAGYDAKAAERNLKTADAPTTPTNPK